MIHRFWVQITTPIAFLNTPTARLVHAGLWSAFLVWICFDRPNPWTWLKKRWRGAGDAL
jgi:hypothetical protein